jgi:hypothetical protein
VDGRTRPRSCQKTRHAVRPGQEGRPSPNFSLEGLSSIYGPIQITEASFRITGLKEPESSFADLQWYITAKRVASQKILQIMAPDHCHQRVAQIAAESPTKQADLIPLKEQWSASTLIS